jgi:hypothetical protein
MTDESTEDTDVEDVVDPPIELAHATIESLDDSPLAIDDDVLLSEVS